MGMLSEFGLHNLNRFTVGHGDMPDSDVWIRCECGEILPDSIYRVDTLGDLVVAAYEHYMREHHGN